MKQTESYIQQQCFIWFNNNFCLPIHRPNQCFMYSVPNELAMMIRSILIQSGVNKRVVDQAVALTLKKMKNTGLTAGVSDTIVGLPGKVLFVEFKTNEGVQSNEQKSFEEKVIGTGNKYYLIRSLEGFMSMIETEYMN